MGKYIQLFEDFDARSGNINREHTWSDLRNQMQAKMPFTIVDFKDEASYQKFKDAELQGKDYIDQTYTVQEEGEPIQMKSIFVFDGDESASEIALDYIKNYNIYRIISGEKGKDFPTLYTEGGSSEFGNDLLIALSPAELGSDDYYQVDSQFYKFIST